MSDQINGFLIGTSRLNSGSNRKKFFYLKPGNNLFRVLPPLFSCAQEGRYSKFHKIHRGFRDQKGWQKAFLCPEEYDAKTKTIIVHCPSCDAYRDAKARYDLAKQQGATKDQLDAFIKDVVQVLQPEKSHYLNVIDGNNEIGVLSIPHKSWLGLQALLKEQFDNGFDPTGQNGCFLNFQKIQERKGDTQTSYPVTLAVEMGRDQNNQMIQRVKMHDLTPDLINRIKNEAFDLNTMYPALTIEQIAILVQLQPQERAVTLEKFLGAPAPVQQPLTGTVPGTDARALVTPAMQNGQMTFNQFGAPAPSAQPAVQQSSPLASPLTPPVQTLAPQAAPIVNTPPAQTLAPQAPLAPPAAFAPLTPPAAPKATSKAKPKVDMTFTPPPAVGTSQLESGPSISDEDFAQMFAK